MPDSGTLELFAPEYNHATYDFIFPDASTFKTKVKATGIIKDALITDTFLEQLFAMLYAKHGTDPIKSSNVEQFIFKLALVTETYAPTYLKKAEIQKQLRNLTEDDIREGYKNIINRAVNPSTTPSTDNTDELPYISAQDVNKGKKSKVDSYLGLWEVLRTEVIEEFLKKYNKLFSAVASTTNRIIYY